jgi:hypothetical protein
MLGDQSLLDSVRNAFKRTVVVQLVLDCLRKTHPLPRGGTDLIGPNQAMSHLAPCGAQKEEGRALGLSLRSLPTMVKLVDEFEPKLNHATGQADVAEIGETGALEAGVFQSDARQISVGVNAVTRIGVIQDVEC